MRESLHCKILLVLLMVVFAPARMLANEMYGNTSSNYATPVGDFAYFFYKSYDVPGGQTLTNVCTMAVYKGEDDNAVIPSTVTYGGVQFPVVGIDWRFRESANYGKCKQLTIPNSVIVIEQGVFNDIDQITHLTFQDGPDGLHCYDCGTRHTKYGAFTYMDGLQEVYLGRNLTWDFEEYVHAPFYRNNDGSYFNVTVGPEVSSIAYHMFDHARVKGVNFMRAETAINVDEDAFNDCNIEVWEQYRQVNSSSQPCKGSGQLHVIRIGGTTTSIKDGEFQDCYNVWELNLTGASILQTIGDHAFEDCDDAEEVFIPKSVTRIGYEAFYDMDDLRKITFEDSTTPLDMTGGFVFYGYDGYSKELQEVYVGRTLKLKEGNENYEFADRNKITTVTIGSGCEEIPNKMFQNCHSLHTIDMSKATSLKLIGQHAFEDCDEVASITIPKSVTWIGYEAFYDMDKLVSITIEDSPVQLDLWEGAQFRSYDNKSGDLRSVYVGRNLMVDVDGYQKDNFYNRKITNVSFGRYVTEIPEKIFYNNPFASITFNIGAGPLRIGKSALVGDGNTTVSSIIIPTPVSYIGEDAFYDNTSLVTVSLNMAKDALIEKNAFENCELISTVIVDLDETMSSSQGSDCFEPDIYGRAILRVNAGDAAAAASQELWKNFTRRDASYQNQISFDYNGLTYNLTQGDDGVFRFQNSLGELQTFILKDNVAINAPVDFEAIVSYDRTITRSSEKWAETIFLPFGMEKPAGVKLYTLCPVQVRSSEGYKVTLEEADSIEAFKSYIFELEEEGTYNFPVAKRIIKGGHDDVVFKADNYFTFTGTIDGKGTNQKQLVPTGESMKFTTVEEPLHPYRAMLQTDRSYTDFEAVLFVDVEIQSDATDNLAKLKGVHDKVGNITFKGITFHKDGNWHPIFLPFSLETLEGTPLEGAELRKLTNSDCKENVLSLYFSKHEGVVYYAYPYIYRFDEEGEDIDNPCFERVHLYVPADWYYPRSFGDVSIYGSYDAVTINASDRFALYLDNKSTFCNPETNVKLDACSIYLKTDEDKIGFYEGTKSLMTIEGDLIRFDLDIVDAATGIETIENGQSKMEVKQWYDLNGRRFSTEPSMKGVYVHDGKKVVIK